MKKKRIKLNSFQIIVFGFLGLILTGALLLMLPAASRDGRPAGPMTALFTSTSAVCVTGLVVRNTATAWSFFGQLIILLLIQIGGMGVVLVASVLAMLTHRKISLMQRSTMQDALSAPQVGGIVRLARFILKFVIAAETAGALALMPVFIRDYGILHGIWFSVFHSISAFCNAGFDLLGILTPYCSLTGYAADPLVNITIMGLIVTGGLGFLTWNDILNHGFRFHQYRMQTKVVLTATALLILLPAVYFYFGEYAYLPAKSRLAAALFQSVTPRTAGFNTTDLTKLSDTGVFITIMLMLIGGAPGSTAGGMKVSTFAVVLLTVAATLRQDRETRCFGRRIDDSVLRQAVSILFLYVTLFLFGGFIISRAESLPLLPCLFETASAIGTVGLTLGITPQLHTLSRLILIALMYAGRVGGLTLIFAAFPHMQHISSRYVREHITVG